MVVCLATSVPADVPDMGKRQLMNLLLLGAVSLPKAGMLVPYASFFMPPKAGGGSDGTVAKDALGNDIIAAGERTLAQGVEGVLLRCYTEVPMLGFRHPSDIIDGCYTEVAVSLALAHVDVDDGDAVFVPWVETDFRTGEAPWRA